MSQHGPTTEVDTRFSEPDATPTPWADAVAVLVEAPLYWLTTVRSDGRPHVTPLIGVWLSGAMYVTTGPGEQKELNLRTNPQISLTTGTNSLTAGLDVVVEAVAERVVDGDRLRGIATAYIGKYGRDWHFDVDGEFLAHPEGGRAMAFEARPTTAFGFAKGVYAQTRYRFG